MEANSFGVTVVIGVVSDVVLTMVKEGAVGSDVVLAMVIENDTGVLGRFGGDRETHEKEN